MPENEKISLLGRKIFFLLPSALTQNQIIPELAQEEFEVYIIKDENKLRQALKKYPDSIMIASINEAMKEDVWEKIIRGIKENSETSAVDIGIIASLTDDSLKQKYLGQYKINCGFTVIKSDVNVAIKQLVVALNNVSAKGRRKYVRMMMESETNATVNLPMNGTFINGVIKDISAVGFSSTFVEAPGLKKNSLYADIQLRLQSQLLKAEGIVFGYRAADAESVYVFLFTPRVDPSVKSRVRKYIQNHLQTRMDAELK